MDKRQKQVLGVVGGICVAVALILLVVVLRHHDTKKKTVAATATTSTTTGIVGEQSTPSTITLQPVDTAPPTTTTTSTTRPPTTTSTSTSTPTRILTAGDAVLAPPSAPVTRHVDAGASCAQLGDGTPWTVSCGTVEARAGRIAWVLEDKTVKGVTARRAAVWRYTGAAGVWEQTLSATDDDGKRWTGIVERTADVDGDGGPDLAFGFHDQGTGQVLAIDIVDGKGKVTLHDSVYKGSARLGGGRLDTWQAVYPGNEPSCCPPAYEHDVIRYVDAAWRVVSSENVAPATVPPSQL